MPMLDGIINPGLCGGELSVNDVSLHSYAYDCLNAMILWVARSRRWGNTTIPAVIGDHPNPVRVAAAKYDMEMIVGGVYDVDGVHWSTNGYSSPYEGLERTIADLEQSVWLPATPPDATVPGSLLMPSGETREAPAQVVEVDLRQAEKAPFATVTFGLVVPVGAFTTSS